MSMRIVAGKYRHRLISYPDDAEHIRPTKDRIREALFSSLGDITSLVVLDLYSGSGALAIEALSRGAAKAYLVDNSKIALSTIKKNISSLGIDNAEILFMNDFDALESFKNKNIKFDLVLLDPPYQKGEYIKVINYLIDNQLCNSNARVVTECNYELDFSSINNIRNIKQHRYGEIIVNVLYL